MNTKMLLLSGIVISAGAAFANSYIAIVNKNGNDYKTFNPAEWDEIVEYSEWSSGTLSNCSLSPSTESYYVGINFNQDKTCDLNKNRTKTVYLENKESKEKVLKSTTIESQTLIDSSVVSALGTYEATSCLDAKNHYAIGNGTYNIKLGSLTEKVYCDMDNGGWTLLMSTGSDLNLTNMTHEVLNKNAPPTTIDHSRYDYLPKMTDFFISMNTDTVIKFTCKDKMTGTERKYFHKGVSDFNNYFNTSTGLYTGNVECAADSNFSSDVASGYDCFSGNNGTGSNEVHRYFKAATVEYGWAIYTGNTNPQSLRHCGNTWIGDGAGNQSQGYIWFK